MGRWVACAITTLLVIGGVAIVDPPVAHSLVPVHPFPTLELSRTILTNPFNNQPASVHAGDSEGLAYDPVRTTLWFSDDSKFKLFEVDLETGNLLTTVTAAQLEAVLSYGNPPSGAPAGVTRPRDLEAMAYDAVDDVLYAFAGPCCGPPSPHHDPTAFRLVRSAPGGPFVPESYQPLEGLSHFDLSGVGAYNGELWGGAGKTLVHYDYATNTIVAVTPPIPSSQISGHITGVGFSPHNANGVDASADDVWLTTGSGSILYRFTWPGLVPVPNHVIPMASLGLRDTRAVEVVGDQLVLSDGYDFYPSNTPTEFALRIYDLGQSAPVASFATSPSPATGGPPLTVTFTDTSTKRPTAWSWDFGDGSPPVTTQHATHVFGAIGQFTVTLTATNPNGSTTATATIDVKEVPLASFTADAPSGLVPLDVSFTDTSTSQPSDPITAWSWDFGDGSPLVTTQDATHTFTRAGSYPVQLRVTNSFGTATATNTIIVNAPPVASFDASVLSGTAPLEVSFSDTSTGFPAIADWSWNFGDGSPAEVGADAAHLFTEPGTYTVTLLVKNGIGSGTTATKTIAVNGVPSAGFTSSVTAPLSVAFTNTTTSFPAATWSWDFGEGTPIVTTPDPSHVYAASGTYTVTLRATNNVGTATVSQQVVVTGPPSASFGASTTSGPAPLAVGFTDTSTGAPAVTGWSWDFGDGTPDVTTRHPSHVFASKGSYTVTLTVASGGGSSTIRRTITVGSVGSYVGLTPARLLDTRPAATVDGQFRSLGALGANAGTDLTVLGRGGVPAAGVGSVVLNVTAIDPTEESYLTVWPRGGARPTASNLNYVAGQTFPNMVIVPVGANGGISLFNAAGRVHLAVDVLGYFPGTSSFVGLTPRRLMDTRRGGSTVDQLFQGAGALGSGGNVGLTVSGRGGVPAGASGSVALNITAVGATAESFMTVWPVGSAQPTASNLNYRAGQTIPNMVIVPIGANGRISLFNDAGSVDVLVDVLGWFPADPGFTGVAPARLMDTRGGATTDGAFRGDGAVGAGRSIDLVVTGRGMVPANGVGSVALNVTAVGATAESYMTVWPTGRAMPTASNLNYLAGDVFPNMVIVPVGAGGRVSLFNAAGSTDVLVDVLGWFPE